MATILVSQLYTVRYQTFSRKAMWSSSCYLLCICIVKFEVYSLLRQRHCSNLDVTSKNCSLLTFIVLVYIIVYVSRHIACYRCRILLKAVNCVRGRQCQISRAYSDITSNQFVSYLSVLIDLSSSLGSHDSRLMPEWHRVVAYVFRYQRNY